MLYILDRSFQHLVLEQQQPIERDNLNIDSWIGSLYFGHSIYTVRMKCSYLCKFLWNRQMG